MHTNAKKRYVSPSRGDAAVSATPMLWVRHLSKSLAITLTVAVVAVLLLSLLAYFYSDPDRLACPLGLVAAGVTALAGGFSAVRIHGEGALLCGLLNGSVFMVLMMLLSFAFTGLASGYSAGISCLLHAAFLLLSVAGGYLGLHRKPKRKKKH